MTRQFLMRETQKGLLLLCPLLSGVLLQALVRGVAKAGKGAAEFVQSGARIEPIVMQASIV